MFSPPPDAPAPAVPLRFWRRISSPNSHPPFSVFAAARRQLPSSRHPSLILLPPNTSGSHRPSPVLPSPDDTTPSSVTLLRSATAKHHRSAPAAIFVPHPLRHSLLSLPRSAPISYFARFITDPEPDIHRFLRSATGHHSGRRSRRLLPDHQSPQGRPPPNLDKIAKQPLPKIKNPRHSRGFFISGQSPMILATPKGVGTV